MYALTVMSRELFQEGSLVAWELNAGKIHNAIPVATGSFHRSAFSGNMCDSKINDRTTIVTKFHDIGGPILKNIP